MLSLRGYVLAGLGRRAEAGQVLAALAAIAEERYVPPYAFAFVHAGLNQPERALDWLQHAYAVRDVHLIWLPMDPKWDGLRRNPSFAKLLHRCAFTGEKA